MEIEYIGRRIPATKQDNLLDSMLNSHRITCRSPLMFLIAVAGSVVVSPSYAQGDLNAQLRSAVCSQDWGGAIAIVDRMRPLVPSNSPSQGQLTNYRQQLENLLRVNLRLDNWGCTAGQAIPALPSNLNAQANPLPSRSSSVNLPPSVSAAQNFWEGFLDIADAETARVGQALGQERLRQYAASVCNTLQQGGRIRDVPAIATGNIPTPAYFQETIEEASVSAYCPAYINKLE
jgi:hypothetical protein